MSTAERDTGDNESIHELIARQFGLIADTQAASFGVSRQSIWRRVDSGEWIRVLPRVYRAAAAPVTPMQRALAATLWAGDGALASHATAATLFEFDGIRTEKTEIWVPAKRRVRSASLTVHHGGRLDRADRTVLDGVPITTPVRTLIDMAGRFEDDRLLAVMEDLIRRDLVTCERLHARLEALRKSGRVGGGRLATLLDQRGDGRPLESALEARVWTIILESGVRLPRRQFWTGAAGHRYRLDFAWPDLRVALECEGYAYHGGLSKWGRDRARDADLASAKWRVIPVTWAMCTGDRANVIRRLRSSIPRAA